MHRPIQLQGSRPNLSATTAPVQFGNQSNNSLSPNSAQQSTSYTQAYNLPTQQPMQSQGYGFEQQGQPQYDYDSAGYAPQYGQQYDQQYSQYPNQRIDSPVLDSTFGLGVANDQIPPMENERQRI
eukprot:NODE_11_length_54881_cov_1.430718.p38 type:complete len:125 gc:universal NODE_11_length_54881_cov_1.430718:6364-5990(-)